ncbi:hypothetical protein [Rosenbergiella epipactidis]|uniref:hypothetical protein n=1 Tax=Rosenbergiella epipactidis TaxID=1544694 RepID=UPI001F4DC9AF|nr:hypothetical protein [Rosenbergiella epipactidis]
MFKVDSETYNKNQLACQGCGSDDITILAISMTIPNCLNLDLNTIAFICNQCRTQHQRSPNNEIYREALRLYYKENRLFNIMPTISLAASQAHQYAISLPVGDDRTEAFEIYHALHRLQFKGAAKLFMDTTNPLANLADDVERITNLLSNNEWAEHVANTPLGQNLEEQITRLISRFNGSWD